MAREQFQYVAVFTIDGVEHTLRGYSDSAEICKAHLQQIFDHRNGTVEGEEAKLVRIHFKVTNEEAEKVIAESSAKNPDQTTTNPLLLHRPQSEVIEMNQ
jgi:hypothetical protein